MANVPQTVASPVGSPIAQTARKGWAFAREAPLLPMVILASILFLAIFADLLPLHDPEVSVKDKLTGRPVAGTLPPAWMDGGTWRMPLGTDFQSRDILSRVIYGARVSLIVGLVGTLAAGAIGTVLGMLAGYMGKWWDQVIMRITDAWLALPTLIFAIFLASIRGAGLWNIVIILTLVFWSRYARQVRAEVLSLRERDFVKLAEVTGASRVRIMLKHILPNVMNTVMVLFSLTIGVAIIIEASLSFLGVGVPPPTPAWGLMMADGKGPLIGGDWWISVFPGIAIMLLVLAANLLGDWLRVRLDPQLRNR
ncbi:MAG: peptide ABC transporter permease [SAR202 cluster bacterium Io17-Chloro-G4]|nr:MAG: peptide ABC transporter permease [SAR202 cluster bacterium Io17-Chloro-G4]